MPCSSGMTGCRSSCAHKLLVKNYRLERERQVAEADHRSLGYEAELSDFLGDRPIITFKSWLIQSATMSDLSDSITEPPTPDDWEPPAGF